MNLIVESIWYGAGKNPLQSPEEIKFVSEYHKRLEEKRKRGDAKAGFDPKIGSYAELYSEEVEIVGSRLRKGDTVLDVGAGEGRFVEIALQKGVQEVIALDPDLMAIKILVLLQI